MLLNGYTTTLKVLVAGADSLCHQGFVEEDLCSAWTKRSGEVLPIPRQTNSEVRRSKPVQVFIFNRWV